jgi:hypothetical protein
LARPNRANTSGFGSFASILACLRSVRFAFDSDRLADVPGCPKGAKAQMGATPVDASKVSMPDEDDEDDPADKYFED